MCRGVVFSCTLGFCDGESLCRVRKVGISAPYSSHWPSFDLWDLQTYSRGVVALLLSRRYLSTLCVFRDIPRCEKRRTDAS